MSTSLSSSKTIEAVHEDEILILRLNRPEKRNAMSSRLIADLTSALRHASDDVSVRVVLITGSAGSFSAGVDLAEAVEITTETSYVDASTAWRGLTDAIWTCSKPVLACIAGHCITGGLEVALACDIRIAEEDASFAVTSGRIGSVAGMGATQRLPRTIGMGRAKLMLFTGEAIDGVQAEEYGLVDILVKPGKVLEEGLTVARSISGASAPLSAMWHKRAVNEGMSLDLAAALDLESEYSKQAFLTADKREGMTAFLERRKPQFKGR